MKEGTASPVLCRLSFVGPSIVEYFDRLRDIGAPPKGSPLVNRMQRVENHDATGQPSPGSDGALTETGHQLTLGAADQAGLRHPFGQLVESRLVHTPGSSSTAANQVILPDIRVFRIPRRLCGIRRPASRAAPSSASISRSTGTAPGNATHGAVAAMADPAPRPCTTPPSLISLRPAAGRRRRGR